MNKESPSNGAKTPSKPTKSARLRAFARGCVLSSVAICSILIMSGCTTGKMYRLPQKQPTETVRLETTGYCKCGKCCGWKRNWKFQPVVAYGRNKGKPKKVGITAAGTVADWGTIAADTSIYPFGTVMYIPGYGWGRVEDIGGGIEGMHIDLFFPSHREALEWGREWKEVKVWKTSAR
jgi:3D (Asp-Asp-Asp) domain-containing protein